MCKTCWNCQYGKIFWDDETEVDYFGCGHDDADDFGEEVDSNHSCSLFKQEGSDLNG